MCGPMCTRHVFANFEGQVLGSVSARSGVWTAGLLGCVSDDFPRMSYFCQQLMNFLCSGRFCTAFVSNLRLVLSVKSVLDT